MRNLVAVTAILGLICAAPAMAQSTATHKSEPSPSAPASNTANGSAADAQMAPGALQQDVRNDLEKAGFTDIHVMPSSFLVRAKDKTGRPIMMLINPDSVTEIAGVGNAAKPGSTAKN